MIKKINILTKENKYSIEIEVNSIKKKIKNIISNNSNVIFLIDKKVFNVFQTINNYKKQKYICINCSEKIKSFKFYTKLTQEVLRKGVDRKTVIVAIGGGTLGDLSGFIASTLLRGVDLILVPTTLLAQVDSSIGGKNGINTSFGKNLIGTFYQPKLVITELGFLKSLSKRNLVCGFAEILKHSLIYDKNFFNWINKNSKNILEKLNLEILKLAIVKSCKIKSHFILMDEKEKNERMILNFGHTFAHGIEAASNFSRKINHGEAVLIGIIFATRLSFRKKLCSFSTLNKIEDFYNVNSLPSKLDKNFLKKNSNKIVKYMINDKKNTGDRISLILLKKIGKTSNPGQIKITIGEMKKILKNIN